jgi:hypothetical protein
MSVEIIYELIMSPEAYSFKAKKYCLLLMKQAVTEKFSLL